MIKRIGGACWRTFSAQCDDLPAFAVAQFTLLGAGLVLAKYSAVAHSFAGASTGAQTAVLLRAIPFDALFAGGLCLFALLLHLPGKRLPKLGRALVFTGVLAFTLAWLILSFVHVEIYKSLGSPLQHQLLLLAPNTAKFLFTSGAVAKLGAIAGQLVLLGIMLAVSPFLFHGLRQSRTRLAALALLWLAGGAGLLFLPAESSREIALREMNLFSVFWPESQARHEELAPPTRREAALLQELCGAPRENGKTVFGKLERRKYNIILWTWESVGARFLKSYHPLGEARTPHLDRMAANGAAVFSNCYVESPFTVQSAWALLMGQSPPARPVVFTYGQTIPEHGTALPAALKQHGYRTAQFNGSHTSIGRVDRIYKESGFDVFEDCDTPLKNLKQFKKHEWGVQDEALAARCIDWIDSVPRNEPFFCMLWNIDTHYPYEWVDIPAELNKAGDRERYNGCIEHTDRVLGKLYDDLCARKLENDTIIVIAGDHGEGMGRPPRPYERGHSMLVFEDSVHVPLLFIHPGLKRENAAPLDFVCTLTDIYPTLLELVGAPPVQGLDGRSLAATYPPDPFYCRSIVWWPLSIRAGDYKLLLERANHKPQLYNIAKDNLEAHDIAAEHPEITETLLRALIRWSAQRFKTDRTFDYGFSIFPEVNQQTGQPAKRPTIDDLFKEQ